MINYSHNTFRKSIAKGGLRGLPVKYKNSYNIARKDKV